MSEGKGAYYVALDDADTAGGVAAVANPEGVKLLITRAVLHVSTKSTGACTVDAGVAANATTSADTLIDGLSVAATGVFDNLTSNGTNGKSVIEWGATEYVTVSKASGAAAGLAGTLFLEYVRA